MAKDYEELQDELHDIKAKYDYLAQSVFSKLHDAESDCNFYTDLEKRNGELLPDESSEYNRALEMWYEYCTILRDNDLMKAYNKYKDKGGL